MPFPVSRKRVDTLGQQVTARGAIGDEHHDLFLQILEHYQELLDNVAEQVSSIGYEPTTRVKTTGTLIEKLRREHGIKLSRVQDVAGARIVVGRLRAQQDQAVAEIHALFEGQQREPQVIDRRADPRHGYRAVHVIVYPEGIPVEVQVRTTLQDMWAQLFENLADQWGRQIRYGGELEFPTQLIEFKLDGQDGQDGQDGHDEITRIDFLRFIRRLSDDIDTHESAVADLALAGQAVSMARSALHAFEDVAEANEIRMTSDGPEIIKELYFKFREICVGFLSRHESDKRRRGRLIRRNYPYRASPNLFELQCAANQFISYGESGLADVESDLTRQEDLMKSILESLARAMDGVV